MAENDKICHDIKKKIQRNHIMKSMNISLPDTMRDYIEEQVAQGGYSSVSEYFRELVRQDQKLHSKRTTTNPAFRRIKLRKCNRNNSTRLGRYSSSSARIE